jgi:long-chain acyl-CoA synthetase
VLREVKLAASIGGTADGFEPYAGLFGDGDPLHARGEAPLIVYTSGTTGFPKGVEAVPKPPLKPSPSDAEVMLINMPMHHAAAPNQLNRARFNGWTVVLQRRFDPEEALRLIERHRVTQWAAVPTMYRRLFALPREVLGAYDVSSLRQMTTGGGPTPDELKAQIVAHFGPKVAENYGATETGMITHLPADKLLQRPGSCGRANPGVEIEIRNDQGEILPPGEVGIIWARTPTTIRGYLNRDAEDRLDTRGFFKVGDLGRLDDEGYLYLTDRAIDLIVSGGVNIYPAEIEAVLMKHPAVLDAAVIGAPNQEFGEEVWAYVELKPGARADSEGLRDACCDLASYKRPRRIEIVEALPRNTMGKLLKRELRAPLWAARERAI